MNKIIPGFPTPQKNQYKVYVRSITYNQSKYIENCLNGVLIQKTNFPFVHQVTDDCSTDGEQEVIKTWIEKNCDLDSAEYYNNDICTITIAKAKDNPNYTIAAYFLKQNMYGNPKKGELFNLWREGCPYEALCEGDDYWIDSLKLQKQVEFLDAHPDCMLAYHAFKYIYEDGVTQSKIKNVAPEYKAADIFMGVQFQTATTMVRMEVIQSPLYKKLKNMGFNFSDVLMFLSASEMGRLMGIDEVMSVYRVHPHGLTVQSLSKIESRIRNLELWIEALNLLKEENKNALKSVIISQGLANALFNLVMFRHISFNRWFISYAKVCRKYPFESVHIPYLFFKNIYSIAIIKMKQSIYNVLHYPIKWFRDKYVPDYEHVGNDIPAEWVQDYDEASRLIYELLDSDKPCMISRFGVTEFICMENFRKGSNPLWRLRDFYPFWCKKNVMENMQTLSGFFGATGYSSYSRFADLLYQCGKETDLLACWFKNQSLIEKEMSYDILWLLSFEPFWSKCPWTRYLKMKRVLVIHPFAETIKNQYQKRELLFENTEVLPEFKSLTVIKAVQSLGGVSNGFRDWFEALEYMEKQIDAVDYDVALIGCGAYGMPLAAHCKRMGKKAVHVGGALQLFFGIKGNRWENNYGDGKSYIPDYKKLMSNPHWVRPSDKDKPKTADKVESACYW